MTSKSTAAHGKIPATVITGFLGAGKTTMIRNILENAQGRRIALIINEFGDLGVDGDVLKGCGAEACSEDDIIELTNGCICCTVADDFLPTIRALRQHADRRGRGGQMAQHGSPLHDAPLHVAISAMRCWILLPYPRGFQPGDTGGWLTPFMSVARAQTS